MGNKLCGSCTHESVCQYVESFESLLIAIKSIEKADIHKVTPGCDMHNIKMISPRCSLNKEG